MKSVSVILVCLLSFSAFPQTKKDEISSEGEKSSDKPAVYLEYVCQDKNAIRLRMYNNTSWAISVKSNKLYYYTNKIVKLSNGKEFFAMPTDKEVSLQFRVEKYALPWENVKVPKVAQSDAGSLNWIARQDSVLFPVPIKVFRDDLQILVRFNYEWEMTERGFFNSEPEHRVSFRGLALSNQKPQNCVK